MAYWVLDDNNNKVEALDLEGVLAAINKAIADGSLEGLVKDSAFVSKLKCCVGGTTHQLAFVTQAKYNELEAAGQLIQNCLYYILDDDTNDELNERLTTLLNEMSSYTAQVLALQAQINNIKKDYVRKVNLTVNTEESTNYTYVDLTINGIYVITHNGLNVTTGVWEDKTTVFAFDRSQGHIDNEELILKYYDIVVVTIGHYRLYAKASANIIRSAYVIE